MKDALLPKFSLSLLVRFELTGPEGPVELPNKKPAGLSGLHRPRAAAATKAGDLALGLSFRDPGATEPAPDPVQVAGPRLRQYGTMRHRLRRRSAQAAPSGDS